MESHEIIRDKIIGKSFYFFASMKKAPEVFQGKSRGEYWSLLSPARPK